jgi:hypothetical protein
MMVLAYILLQENIVGKVSHIPSLDWSRRFTSYLVLYKY